MSWNILLSYIVEKKRNRINGHLKHAFAIGGKSGSNMLLTVEICGGFLVRFLLIELR
jgi:hypothetical protein